MSKTLRALTPQKRPKAVWQAMLDNDWTKTTILAGTTLIVLWYRQMESVRPGVRFYASTSAIKAEILFWRRMWFLCCNISSSSRFGFAKDSPYFFWNWKKLLYFIQGSFWTWTSSRLLYRFQPSTKLTSSERIMLWWGLTATLPVLKRTGTSEDTASAVLPAVLSVEPCTKVEMSPQHHLARKERNYACRLERSVLHSKERSRRNIAVLSVRRKRMGLVTGVQPGSSC